MDSIEKLTTAIAMVEEARGVPLSASCVLHRGEILEILDGARAALPNDLEAARKILASRDSLIEEGRTSAEALIASAREEVSRMIEQTAIVSAAREEAQHILDDAHLEADGEREEVEQGAVCHAED
jgi:vacuolar-type H+-ATPase subunit H